ncbi:MAG TPA: hypothetical protein VJC03_02330, partial [bacterium]|nr:hypothetical protein [bacterium]
MFSIFPLLVNTDLLFLRDYQHLARFNLALGYLALVRLVYVNPSRGVAVKFLGYFWKRVAFFYRVFFLRILGRRLDRLLNSRLNRRLRRALLNFRDRRLSLCFGG